MKITLKTAEKRCFLLIASADLDRLNPLCFTSPAALKKADPIVDMLKHFQAKFWWFWSLKWNLNWFRINFGFHFKLQNHQNFAYKCFKMSTMGSAFFSAAGHNGLRKFKSPLWKYSFWSQKWCISFVIYSKTIPGTKRKPNAKLKLTAFSKKKGRQTCRNSFSAVSKAMALRFCTYSALSKCIRSFRAFNRKMQFSRAHFSAATRPLYPRISTKY